MGLLDRLADVRKGLREGTLLDPVKESIDKKIEQGRKQRQADEEYQEALSAARQKERLSSVGVIAKVETERRIKQIRKGVPEKRGGLVGFLTTPPSQATIDAISGKSSKPTITRYSRPRSISRKKEKKARRRQQREQAPRQTRNAEMDLLFG